MAIHRSVSQHSAAIHTRNDGDALVEVRRLEKVVNNGVASVLTAVPDLSGTEHGGLHQHMFYVADCVPEVCHVDAPSKPLILWVADVQLLGHLPCTDLCKLIHPVVSYRVVHAMRLFAVLVEGIHEAAQHCSRAGTHSSDVLGIVLTVASILMSASWAHFLTPASTSSRCR